MMVEFELADSGTKAKVSAFYHSISAVDIAIDEALFELWIISKVKSNIDAAIKNSDGTVVATTVETTPTAVVVVELTTTTTRRRRTTTKSSKLKTIILFQALSGQTDLSLDMLMPFIILQDEEDDLLLVMLVSMMNGDMQSSSGIFQLS